MEMNSQPKLIDSNNNGNDEANELLRGQAEVLDHLFAFADSLVVRSAIELRIPDIIHSHDKPMTLEEIASKIESSTTDVTCLARVMRVLVRKKLFKITNDNEELPLYGPTIASKWLVRDFKLSLAPLFLTFTHQSMMSSWHKIGRAIKEGGTPFEKAHGESIWEKGSKDADFNELFTSGMTSLTRATTNAIINGYSHGFSKLEGTLVDVGGCLGKAVADIVEAYPHINGINFDLPHVVATAPQYDGVTHIGGDMFKEIPKADTLLVKSVLHDWGDDDCLKILKNCQKAISEKKGKVIIVDIVLQPQGEDLLDDSRLYCDLLMMAHGDGGKERTENDWKKLLTQAGFATYNIIPIPSLLSIIEAFP